MLTILIDAGVLIALLKGITDDDVNFGLACVIALGAAIGVAGLTFGLAEPIGPLWALIVAANVIGLLLGVLISALFGTALKQSFFVGGIFVLVHIGIALCMSFLFTHH